MNLERINGGIRFAMPAASSSRPTTVEEAEVGGFFKLAEPLLARMAQRQCETNLSNLKNLLEAQA